MKGLIRNTPAASLAIALLVLGGLAIGSYPASADLARTLPPPLVDAPPGQSTSAVVVLAGGCFWGVQGVFQHVKGVTSAVSGYAGGEKKTANYEDVGRGKTGHAESVQVTYDPRQISYGRLLQVFFSVVHDPTQLNRQGPDVGPQYRSAIFPSTSQQADVARAYIAQLDQAHLFKKAIVTRIESDRPFYVAEDYHQDYLVHNPSSRYVIVNDLPKIADLKQIFPELYRVEPVLVSDARSTK